jgi:ATP-binding cassette subfamily B protein
MPKTPAYMTQNADASDPVLQDISADLRLEVAAQLYKNESVLASLVFDLDDQLHFVKGLVLVTEQRLLSRAPDTTWQTWGYQAGLAMHLHDHAGVGHLELLDSNERLAHWSFKLAHNLHAIRLLDQFHIHQTSQVTGE